MKILIAGSSGFIGSELAARLKDKGHEVISLIRSGFPSKGSSLVWDPEHRQLNPQDFEKFDLVVNLAGENIASGRWTAEKKKKIKDSRVLMTHMLSNLLATLQFPPKLFINASAVGYYGNQGDRFLDENTPAGSGFLADVCAQWENSTEPAREKGVRIVMLRFGVVLSPKGGVLKKMLPSFKYGLGGTIGSGEQYVSWIALEDVIAAISYIIENESIQGPVNIVSPHPVTNRTFTKILGKVLKRWTILPLPAGILRLALGEMAEETLLSSARVLPKVLENSDYSFLYPELENALRHMLRK